jgi:AcrR family transcriptional regulator
MTIDVEPASLEERPLRRDAARNRELILEAASDVFAERGLEAGYDEIARRAGVGVGTVYRRFPERIELVQALFESRIEGIVAMARQAASEPDPWVGLTQFIERTLAQQVADRGLKEVMVQSISPDQHQRVGREQLTPIIGDLIARAQSEGQLRGDVGPQDLGALLMMLGSISTPDAPELWRRYLALVLDGLRARPDHAKLPLEQPTEAMLRAAMISGRR